MSANNNPDDAQQPPQNNSNNPMTSNTASATDPGNPGSPSFASRVAAIQARTNVSQSSAAAAVNASVAAAASMYNQPPTVAMAMAMQNPAPVQQPTLPPLAVLRKQKYKKRTKKYNNFNIFFMLERQLLLHSRGGGGIDAVKNPVDVTSEVDSPLAKHKDLKLPGLCRRYNHLPLTANWFLELLANQNKKRPHRKSHGLIPFKELAQTIAKNYKEIDEETQEFVNEVAERLAWHYEELEKEEEKERKEYEKKYGIPPPQVGGYVGKKRKEAPIVSKGTGPEMYGDPAAYGMGMGMNQNNPYGMPHSYGGMPGGYPPSSYPGMGQMYPPHNMPPASNNSGGGPSSQQQFPNTRPRASSPGGSGGGPNDVEGQRLHLEMARAMSERDESLHRIGLLKTQMNIHQSKQRADFARFENELLMEALIRRMTPAPSGAEGGRAASSASSRPGGMNAPPSPSVLASYLNQQRGGAPHDKRQKFDENDFNAKSDSKESSASKKKDGSPEAVRGGSAEGWIVQ